MSGWSIYPWLLGYIILFIGSSLGMLLLMRKQRSRRFPLPENTKLLRMPGEHIWRQISTSEENDVIFLLGAASAPFLTTTVAVKALIPIFQRWPIPTIILLIIIFTVTTWLACRFMAHRMFKRSDKYLGFFGERYVGEYLDELKQWGWKIFHDVPFSGVTGPYNIDHIAVGPRGIWIVETKTRRKGDPRPGLKEHEVLSDGETLTWPWGEEKDTIRQAKENARSFKEWLKEMTGQDVPVSAVVAIPGWMVVDDENADVRVTNPKRLVSIIGRTRNTPLTPEQVDLFRRQLGAKCRDVVY